MLIPTIIALPVGMLYPINSKGEMKWSLAPMVEIPEDERKDFPNEQGGFYDKKIDTENAVIYDLFFQGMVKVNELLKQKASSGE